jgi:formyltetrahydrofolate-dependent phosphoribosylglycinamide formyltransferase
MSEIYRVAVVISDREDARALDRARTAGRDALVISVKDRSQGELGDEVLRLLRDRGVEVIALAGYLKLIPPAVVAAYPRRILNIHPALLPAFGGKGMYGERVHQAVLAEGTKVTGATVHYVDEEYDTGTIVAQWPVPVLPGDDVQGVAARVLKVEHRLYPAVVDHLCGAVAEGKDPGPFTLTAVDSGFDSHD